jgi:hypothetical protein
MDLTYDSNDSNDSENSDDSIKYCCYIYANSRDDEYHHRCNKDDGDIGGRSCKHGCMFWVCNRHPHVTSCFLCGKPIDSY